MKMFDDGFDMESIPMYAPEEDDSIVDPGVMDVDTQAASQPAQPHDTLKEEEPEEDVVSDLLPGARAMKRRRAEMSQHPTEGLTTATEAEPPKRKRAKLDVLEAARKHREQEEEQRKAEENIRLGEADVGVDQLKNLAIVEEMELPVRSPPTREEENIVRWEDRWNGRKNFKKFRRKGESHGRARMQAVIVPLEEVTRKEYGIGDHYWSNNSQQPNSVDENRVNAEEDSESRPQESATVNSPEPAPVPTPARRQKRARESRDSDSDDGTRFRFRRKR